MVHYDSAQPGRHVMALVFVTLGIVVGICGLPTSGFAVEVAQGAATVASATTTKGSSSRSNKESPANYGTSPSNIANGGHVAHAHGKTYFVTLRHSSGSCIACREDGSNTSKVLYRNVGELDAWGNKDRNGFPISCLHVTDDSLVFVEKHNDGSSQFYYYIVRTKLDGTGREIIRSKLDMCAYGSQQWSQCSYMWLDGGYIYYRDVDGICRQPLNGTKRERVVEADSESLCAVADGVVYSTDGKRKTVVATDTASGTSKTVFSTDKFARMETGTSKQDGANTPTIATLIPNGDRIYCGYVPGTVRLSYPMDGCISFDRNGGNERLEYSGAYDADDDTGLVGLSTLGDRLFAVYGTSREGTQLAEVTGNGKELNTLFEASGGKDGGDTISQWTQIVDNRIYFQFNSASEDPQSIREKDLGLEVGDTCSMPWSVKLDGSDLHKD